MLSVPGACPPACMRTQGSLFCAGGIAPESPEFRWGRRGEPGPCVATCPGLPLPLSVRNVGPERFPGICKFTTVVGGH